MEPVSDCDGCPRRSKPRFGGGYKGRLGQSSRALHPKTRICTTNTIMTVGRPANRLGEFRINGKHVIFIRNSTKTKFSIEADFEAQ
jgi:hypothetical protein